MAEATHQPRTTVARFDIEDGVILRLPAGSKIVSVAWYDDGARMWVANDPMLPKVSRKVRMLTTGLDVYGDNWECVGTIFGPRKQLWHVFIETE